MSNKKDTRPSGAKKALHLLLKEGEFFRDLQGRACGTLEFGGKLTTFLVDSRSALTTFSFEKLKVPLMQSECDVGSTVSDANGPLRHYSRVAGRELVRPPLRSPEDRVAGFFAFYAHTKQDKALKGDIYDGFDSSNIRTAPISDLDQGHHSRWKYGRDEWELPGGKLVRTRRSTRGLRQASD